jgi:hypothetical protein
VRTSQQTGFSDGLGRAATPFCPGREPFYPHDCIVKQATLL